MHTFLSMKRLVTPKLNVTKFIINILIHVEKSILDDRFLATLKQVCDELNIILQKVEK